MKAVDGCGGARGHSILHLPALIFKYNWQIPLSSLVEIEPRRQEVLLHAGVCGAERGKADLRGGAADDGVEWGEQGYPEVVAVSHHQPTTGSSDSHAPANKNQLDQVSQRP